jgi:cobalamin biosynthesis Mg chelatase CobN
MIRTQLFLDKSMHARLRSLARAQGRTMSDLVREAIQRIFTPPLADERERTLRAIEGLWRDRSDIRDEAAYVRSLRRSTRRPSRRKD